MTTRPQDANATLDAIEEIVELRRAAPDVLLPKIATLLLGLPGDSPHRPRVYRLLGVLHNRLKLDRDALRELREAKALAESASPSNYRELAKIGRETAVAYAWRGDGRCAAVELLSALAFASLEGDAAEVAKIIAEFGRIELEAQRFDNAAMLLGPLVSQGSTLKLPPREAQRVRVNLCQALNRLDRYEEALQHVAALHGALPENETRLRFLTRLEEARAHGGLGRHDEAENALRAAKKLLPEKDSAYEHSEFIQAVTELQEVRGGPPAVESLEHLIKGYAEQRFVVREAVARRALAGVLFKSGETDRAREALAQGLRNALQSNLVELADDIRADMLKGAGNKHLEDLAETINVIDGNTAPQRRFIRLGLLGEAGEVSHAIDLADGRHVALKTVDLRGLPETERQAAIRTIKTEYGAATKLEDPRFARVLDLRMAPGGALFIVRRYVKGPTLRELYTSGVQPERLLDLLAGIADALAVLHARGIVHRDLKPENVIAMRDASGRERPVLIDLGIALVAGRAVVTPPYVAPEQVAGAAGDARADIYALGQMIAEIWGGKMPSRAALGRQMIAEIWGGKMPSRAGLGRLWQRGTDEGMPHAIGDIVREMLAPDPAHRTSDLTNIADALKSQCRRVATS